MNTSALPDGSAPGLPPEIVAVAGTILLGMAPRQHLEFGYHVQGGVGHRWRTLTVRNAGATLSGAFIEVRLDPPADPDHVTPVIVVGWSPVIIQFGPARQFLGWNFRSDTLYSQQELPAYLTFDIGAERPQPKLTVRWWSDRSGPNDVEPVAVYPD